MMVVSGADRVLDVKFTSFVLVSFDVSGIPKGSIWSVTIDGKQFNGSSQILSIRIPNGTYYYVPGSGNNFTYYVTFPSGYSPVSEGSFNATSAVTVPLAAQPTGGGGTGPQGYPWEVIIAVMLVIIVFAVIVGLLARRWTGGGAGK